MLTSIYSADIQEWNKANIESGKDEETNDSKEGLMKNRSDLHNDIFMETSATPEYSDCF